VDNREFSRARRLLGKTQAEIAQLLGVSAKAVQSYEQGWRDVPAHAERQLLFLLYLKRPPEGEQGPCWERTDCPPETRLNCSAWEFRADGICWFINGTICQGEVRVSWERKMQLCRRCEVYRSSFPYLT